MPCIYCIYSTSLNCATDNVNILSKYLMYILTDYRLILTKDTKDRPNLSSERADTSGIALARTSSNNKLQTHPLVREDGTKYQTATTKSSRRTKNWSRVPDGRLTPRRTGRLIVVRNVTSTSSAPHRDNSKFQTENNIWPQVSE
jgi:hypothetical protein